MPGVVSRSRARSWVMCGLFQMCYRENFFFSSEFGFEV